MDSGILSGPEIVKQIEAGRITIDPFDPKKVNPASVDLTLGEHIGIYQGTYQMNAESDDGRWAMGIRPSIWDSKKSRDMDHHIMDAEQGWVLQPGIGYLLHTKERVTTNHYVPVLDGKSSIGRAFILVHFTAGYGDPGFDGQYTLEVTSLFPVRIYPGMRFCQMRFHTMVGEPLLYKEKGHYQGEAAQGAVASQIHRQFD